MLHALPLLVVGLVTVGLALRIVRTTPMLALTVLVGLAALAGGPRAPRRLSAPLVTEISR